jgi:hypothetical protein
VRNDDPSASPRPEEGSASASPSPPRNRRIWAWVLGPLILATSLAVASLHPGLVLPYLLLMAWLVFPARPARDAEPSAGRSDPGIPSLSPQSPESISSALRPPEPVSPGEPGESAEASADVATSARPRRGKGRGRKAKAAAEGPPAVVWVRVAPGKFIRVEGPEATAEAAGPLSLVPDLAPPLADLAPASRDVIEEAGATDLTVSPASDRPTTPVGPEASIPDQPPDQGPVESLPTDEEAIAPVAEAIAIEPAMLPPDTQSFSSEQPEQPSLTDPFGWPTGPIEAATDVAAGLPSEPWVSSPPPDPPSSTAAEAPIDLASVVEGGLQEDATHTPPPAVVSGDLESDPTPHPHLPPCEVDPSLFAEGEEAPVAEDRRQGEPSLPVAAEADTVEIRTEGTPLPEPCPCDIIQEIETDEEPRRRSRPVALHATGARAGRVARVRDSRSRASRAALPARRRPPRTWAQLRLRARNRLPRAPPRGEATTTSRSECRTRGAGPRGLGAANVIQRVTDNRPDPSPEGR